MYLVISLLVLRAGYGIWLYQFLIIAYLFTLPTVFEFLTNKQANKQDMISAYEVFQKDETLWLNRKRFASNSDIRNSVYKNNDFYPKASACWF